MSKNIISQVKTLYSKQIEACQKLNAVSVIPWLVQREQNGLSGDVAQLSMYQWVQYCVVEFANKKIPLSQLDSLLQSTTYLVDFKRTLADVLLILHLREYERKELAKYVNVTRYFNSLQKESFFDGLEDREIAIEEEKFVYHPIEELNAPPQPKISLNNSSKAETKEQPKKKEGKQPQGKQNDGKDQKKKDKKEKKEKKAKPQPKAQSLNPNTISFLVGKVLTCKEHPEARSLLVEEIDVGEEKPRTICSGLKGLIDPKDIQGKHVVVMANLKPAKMVGIESNGMLVCNSDEGKKNVALVKVPEGAAPGDRIIFEGQPLIDASKRVNSKQLGKLLPNFKTNEKGEAIYEEQGKFRMLLQKNKQVLTGPFPNSVVS